MLNSIFEQIAEATWRRLEQAKRLDVRLGEETLTDILALELARSNTRNVRLIQTTKADEAKQGTDIEMRIHTDRSNAIPLAIQAKKINRLATRYDSLSAKIDTKRRQIDVLDFYAKGIGAKPLYLLFNHIPRPHQSTWHCTHPFDPPQLGCTLVPSARIRQVLAQRGHRNFHSIHSFPDAIPWRCIECLRGHVLRLPCTKRMDSRVAPLRALADADSAQEGAWPEWLWEHPGDTLSEDDLTRLHGGEIRLPATGDDAEPPEEASGERADRLNRAAFVERPEPPRLVPRWVLLVDQDE